MKINDCLMWKKIIENINYQWVYPFVQRKFRAKLMFNKQKAKLMFQKAMWQSSHTLFFLYVPKQIDGILKQPYEDLGWNLSFNESLS